MLAAADPAGMPPSVRGSFTPVLYRIVERRVELDDVVTLSVNRASAWANGPFQFAHGQFNMLTAFGVGEAAMSISSSPRADGLIEHTVRDVGAVSSALCGAQVGSLIGVRGPFGRDWGLPTIEDAADVVVVAGGIGLAPLRGAIRDLAEQSGRRGGRVFVLVGARSPGQVLFPEELEAWRAAGVHVDVAVDVGAPDWGGSVGVVTVLLPQASFEPATTVALLCGPEIMMRFVARQLVDQGVDPYRIRVSLERNMQCGVGLCGHCQFGPLLVCRDGPVVTYGGMADELFMERNR
jgi:anaerobic sulfite reductase subunit B